METQFELATIPEYPRTKQDRQLVETTYSNFFEHALDTIASGRTLSSIIEDDHRCIQYARFLRWVKKNPQRLARYHEAQEIAAEILVGDIIRIADETNEENVQSRNTQIKSRQWVAGSFNPKKYGQNKRIDMNVTEVTEESVEKMSVEEIERRIREIEASTIEPEWEDVEDEPDPFG
jgi:hypothetical protein